MNPRRAALVAMTVLLAVTPSGIAWGQGAPMFGGFLTQSQDPISVDADSLQWLIVDGREVLEYRGDVVAVRGDMTIRAAQLNVYLPAADAEGGGAFDRIEASGNVSVVAGNQRATAETAMMDMVAQTVVMTGNVALSDGANQMSGERLTVDLATGGWRLEAGSPNGRVRTVVNPGG